MIQNNFRDQENWEGVGFRLKVKVYGQSYVAFWYLTPLLGYFILPHVD